MSQLTETTVRRSPADAEVDAYLAPLPHRPSAKSAFIAGARLLVAHPEFAPNDALKWTPHHDGRLDMQVHLMDPIGCEVLSAFAAILGIPVAETRWTSSKFGPVVGLRVCGDFDGARWDVWAQVSAKDYAAYQTARAGSVAA